jgi:membrane associated rhomboid family serine protease
METAHLEKRPLLEISIAPKSWSLEKAIISNFIHGSFLHLVLNLIGILAGLRICTAFMPFLCSFSIFLVGGTAGLLFSILLNSHSTGNFVPHLGASAGVFALMGAYYVYNFRFRTTYFFWFPSRHGSISLKTSWFFFFDVFLLELLLSSAQLIPQTFDGVDHLAHVGGFLAGLFLALVLRTAQRWPGILQTRGEFLYWTTFLGPKLKELKYDPVQSVYMGWNELLKINFFNDQLKSRLAAHLTSHCSHFSDEQVRASFRYFGPTFTRLHRSEVAQLIFALQKEGRVVPEEWLRKMPYDSIIRICQKLILNSGGQEQMLILVLAYQKAQRSNHKISKKLASLIEKVQSLEVNRPLASGE